MRAVAVSELNRTPLASPPNPNARPTSGSGVSAAINPDGIDTRKFLHLSRAEQIEWLEAKGRYLHEYYLGMTAAYAYLKAQQTKEVTQ
jgi:hypothetical protein